jgi:predicted O-methyltransferase YrrM
MSLESTKPKKKGRPKKATAELEPMVEQSIEQPIEQYALEPLARHEWSAEEEVGNLLSALIKCHKATNVLELGTLEGYVTQFLIKSVNELGGTLTSVDVNDNRKDITKKMMEDGGHKFITGSSLDVCKTLPRASYDLIYVDTIHEWYHALPEFKLIEHLVKQGGIMVYHDTIKFPDMRRLSNYVKAFRFESVTIRTPEGNGLSIIQK